MIDGDVTFRQMTKRDVKRVLSIIQSTQSNAYEDAKQSFRKGLEGERVCEYQGTVVGVAGFHPVEGTDRSAMLSWIFLDPDAGFPGGGVHYLRQVLKEVAAEGFRKLFAEVGSQDPPVGSSTLSRDPKLHFVEAGFSEEVTHLDFYAPHESVTILGIHLTGSPEQHSHGRDDRLIAVHDAFEIDEADDLYTLDWSFCDAGEQSTPAEIGRLLSKIQRWGGRGVILGLPGNAEAAQEQVTLACFRPEGVLTDMIEDGLDEARYRVNL